MQISAEASIQDEIGKGITTLKNASLKAIRDDGALGLVRVPPTHPEQTHRRTLARAHTHARPHTGARAQAQRQTDTPKPTQTKTPLTCTHANLRACWRAHCPFPLARQPLLHMRNATQNTTQLLPAEQLGADINACAFVFVCVFASRLRQRNVAPAAQLVLVC